MKNIKNLQSGNSLHDVAFLFGYSPSSLSYILYVDKSGYHQYKIPKRSGGIRVISCPNPILKALQSKLSLYLYDCLDEINASKNIKSSMSHAFKRGYSIETNASKHRNKRFVFNIDLEDFFGSINFGRVRGFFIKNKNFKLNSKVATILAQICCYENKLPQGSPCSPIISNLIGHIIDIKLCNLSKDNKCYFTRYADDITFSTNLKEFPKEIAIFDKTENKWLPSSHLKNTILDLGFRINESKTSMQYKMSRQVVTGLVVNRKIGIKKEYSKTARAMVNHLFKFGFYNDNAKLNGYEKPTTIPRLNGILSFINQIDNFKNRDKKKEYRDLNSREKLYRQFLIYKDFYKPLVPTILCEGKTDNIYLKSAISVLYDKYPNLQNNSSDPKVRFYNYSNTSKKLLNLDGGSGNLKKFINPYLCEYDNLQKIEQHESKKKPFIILLDNDKGAKKIFSIVKELGGYSNEVDGTDPFYFLGGNLYILAIPKIANKDTVIEDYFDEATLDMLYQGKKFNKSNDYNTKTEYGKYTFATKIVKRNKKTIDFEEFTKILDNITLVVEDFNAKQRNSLEH